MREFYSKFFLVSLACFLILGIIIFFDNTFIQMLRVIFHLALVILVIGIIGWHENRRKRKEQNIWKT